MYYRLSDIIFFGFGVTEREDFIMKLLKFTGAAVLLLLLAGCSTGYWREKCVERARVFVLDRTKDFSQTQRDYIRYAPPYFIQEPIIRRDSNATDISKKDIIHTCIVWDKIPGLNYAIMVFGVSEGRMFDWYPCQMIRRKFIPPYSSRNTAVKLSVRYVMDNLLYLSDDQRNRIRFAPPSDIRTDFVLSQEKLDYMREENKLPPDPVITSEMTEEQKEKLQRQQWSFVWDTDDPNKKVVVTGICGYRFGGFRPITGLVRTVEDIHKHTVTEAEEKKILKEEIAKEEKAEAENKSDSLMSDKKELAPVIKEAEELTVDEIVSGFKDAEKKSSKK